MFGMLVTSFRWQNLSCQLTLFFVTNISNVLAFFAQNLFFCFVGLKTIQGLLRDRAINVPNLSTIKFYIFTLDGRQYFDILYKTKTHSHWEAWKIIFLVIDSKEITKKTSLIVSLEAFLRVKSDFFATSMRARCRNWTEIRGCFGKLLTLLFFVLHYWPKLWKSSSKAFWWNISPTLRTFHQW